jgi:hypothetical protein
MRMYITSVFGALFEELQKKWSWPPTPGFFSGVGVVEVGHVWHAVLLEFLEWSSVKYVVS